MITAMLDHTRQRLVAVGIILTLLFAAFFTASVVNAGSARADVYTSLTYIGGYQNPLSIQVQGTNASSPTYKWIKEGQVFGGHFTPGFHPARYYLPANCTARMYVFNQNVFEGRQDHWVSGWKNLAWERENKIEVNCTFP